MKGWMILSLGVTAAATAASLVVYANRAEWLPEKTPTHWNAQGIADQFIPRDDMLPYLLIMPGTMLGMVALAQILPWLSPAKFKIEPFRKTYDYIMALVVILFAYLDAMMLVGSMGKAVDVGRWLVGGMLLILALLGNVLGKVKRNFYVGVRTPWTLASDTVWIRTHRVAAWLFTAGGLVGLGLVLLGVNAILALSVFGLAAIAPAFYSLWLYKRLEKQGRLGNETQPQG